MKTGVKTELDHLKRREERKKVIGSVKNGGRRLGKGRQTEVKP